MIILLAESKTMAPCEAAVSPDAFAGHCPVFNSRADSIMGSLGHASPAELAKDVKISGSLALRLQAMIREFPNKLAGSKAIEAFTGVVFKAFGYSSLSEPEKAETGLKVRIISSLYGWLRADDFVKPYRFDFTTPLAPDGQRFAAYWREDVTSELLAELVSSGSGDVLSLLPADAEKSIDWKRLEGKAKVWRADFRSVGSGARLTTPHAGKLKTLRGRLLRRVIMDRINSPEQLMSLSGEDFMSAGEVDAAGNILFHTV